MSTSHIQTLRAMLREEKGVILPGAPNALAARIIADLGFKAVYLTGAGLTNMHLGLPDLHSHGSHSGASWRQRDSNRGPAYAQTVRSL